MPPDSKVPKTAVKKAKRLKPAASTSTLASKRVFAVDGAPAMVRS
jgi:hypothetical protein